MGSGIFCIFSSFLSPGLSVDMIFSRCGHLLHEVLCLRQRKGPGSPHCTVLLIIFGGIVCLLSLQLPLSIYRQWFRDLLCMLCVQCPFFFMEAWCINPRNRCSSWSESGNNNKSLRLLSSLLVLQSGVYDRGEKFGGSDSLRPFQFLRAPKKKLYLWRKWKICCFGGGHLLLVIWGTIARNQFERMIMWVIPIAL